jgi:parvulin-like peptidyl-prolyl isomerase
VLGIPWDQQKTRWSILGGAGVLLLFVVSIWAWGFYRERWVRPHQTVLDVAGQEVSLSYYADRLRPFLVENAQSGLSASLLEQSLLTKLEDEELTLLLAQDRGITITDEDVTNAIAEDLGVPVGGDGSAFDNLYRERLKTTAMSDGNYRRLVKAQTADKRIKAQIAADIGDTGELITLRTVVLNAEDKAKDIRTRIDGGEDIGTVAQTESSDLTSRQADGIMAAEPAPLLPQSVRDAIKDKPEGELFGPIQVDQNWWVFRIEKRDPGGTYSQAQKDQLAQQEFDRILKEKRAATKIERDLDGDDIAWAEDHA